MAVVRTAQRPTSGDGAAAEEQLAAALSKERARASIA